MADLPRLPEPLPQRQGSLEESRYYLILSRDLDYGDVSASMAVLVEVINGWRPFLNSEYLRLLQNPSWHGRPAHETRARCPCHSGRQRVLQEPHLSSYFILLPYNF
jgi:hypothetical protein